MFFRQERNLLHLRLKTFDAALPLAALVYSFLSFKLRPFLLPLLLESRRGSFFVLEVLKEARSVTLDLLPTFLQQAALLFVLSKSIKHL